MEKEFDMFASADHRRLHQRRRFSRATVRWPVTIINNEQTQQGIVKNISQGGVLLYLPEHLDVHDTIRLGIEINDCSSVLTAEGEVINVTPLKNLVEKKYAYSAAIQFTNISNEDLKYFTGNLAPEWYENGIAAEPSAQMIKTGRPTYNNLKKIALYTGSSFCVLLLFFYLFARGNDETDKASEIASLYERINEQQMQLTLLQDSKDTLAKIEGEIQTVNQQMLIFQAKLSSISASMDTLEEEISDKTKAISIDYNDISQAPKVAAAEPVYYVVKKGENLYRISLVTDTNIEALREKNNLSAANKIFPGQKLIIR